MPGIADTELTAVSVFSGVGGLDLGVELAGFRVVAQCEAVPYRRQILAERFGGAIYSDVRELSPRVFTHPWEGGELAPESPRPGGHGGDGRDGDEVDHVDGRAGQRDDAGGGDADGDAVHAEPAGGAARAGRGVVAVGGGVTPDHLPRGVDALIGGFPCQDLSVAGKRRGLSGSRSGLYWEIIRLLRDAGAVRPRVVLLENVPGLLSSCSCRGCRKCAVVLRWHRERGCPGDPNSGSTGEVLDPDWKCAVCEAAKSVRRDHAGSDFALVCAALANLGYRVSYRVLDSRYFGVAQRRRRVFMLAELDPGAGGGPEVLLEPEGGLGDPLASGSPWPGAAAALAGGFGGGRADGREALGGVRGGSLYDDDLASLAGQGNGGPDDNDAQAGRLVAAYGLRTRQPGANGDGVQEEESHALNTWGTGAVATYSTSPDGSGREDDLSPTIDARAKDGPRRNQGGTIIAVDQQPADETAATLTKGSHSEGVSFPGRRHEDDDNLVVASIGFVPAMSSEGRLGEEDEVAPTLAAVDAGSSRAAAVYTKTHGAQDTEDAELWDEATEARTLNGMAYATDVVVEDGPPRTLYPTENRMAGETWEDEAPTLKIGTKLGDAAAAASAPAVQQHPGAAVRRLTPRECERLQGFPDDWTLLSGGHTADGPRYAALGDAVTVNVPFWVMSRVRRKLLLARS